MKSKTIKVVWSEEGDWAGDIDADDWLWLPEKIQVPPALSEAQIEDWLISEYGSEPESWSFLKEEKS